jgi:hypothetical protein
MIILLLLLLLQIMFESAVDAFKYAHVGYGNVLHKSESYYEYNHSKIETPSRAMITSFFSTAKKKPPLVLAMGVAAKKSDWLSSHASFDMEELLHYNEDCEWSMDEVSISSFPYSHLTHTVHTRCSMPRSWRNDRAREHGTDRKVTRRRQG